MRVDAFSPELAEKIRKVRESGLTFAAEAGTQRLRDVINKNITEEELKYVGELYNLFGKYELLEEKDFHAFIALCGSSPAYVFMFIEAMADAGVKLGIPRAKAYKLAEQSILGSAKLALETGKHPGVLKDEVCSPGGTTIEAVNDLEKNGFRSTVISAIEKCADKSKNM